MIQTDLDTPLRVIHFERLMIFFWPVPPRFLCYEVVLVTRTDRSGSVLLTVSGVLVTDILTPVLLPWGEVPIHRGNENRSGTG